MTIGVVYGGTAEERGASEKNAKDIAAVLSERGHNAILFKFDNDIIEQLKRAKIEIVFLCVQGKGYGDGTFQRMLESAGIPYTGSGVRSASLINNKILCKFYFDIFGVRTPKWDVLSKKVFDNNLYTYENFGFPFVAKAPTQGGSYGIELIKGMEDIPNINIVFRYDDPILLESYISGKFYTVGLYEHEGRLVTLPVVEGVDLGDKDRRAAEIGSDIISFTGSYGIRKSDLSKEMEEEMQSMARTIFKVTGALDVARVDFMVSDADGKPYALEINAVPGLKKLSLMPKEAELAGISYGDLIEDILKAAVRRSKDV